MDRSFVGGALDGAGFAGDDGAWTGTEEDCACPDFFELDGRHMLLCIRSRTRGAAATTSAGCSATRPPRRRPSCRRSTTG